MMSSLKYMIVLSCLTALAASAAIEQKEESPVRIKFVTGDKLNDFLKEYPDAVKLERKLTNVTKFDGGQNRDIVIYTLGVRRYDDFLVSQETSDLLYWNQPRDAWIDYYYPANGGQGYVVTFVEIAIDQSNGSGDTYLLGGGIGYRNIALHVEAYQTFYFRWNIRLYGMY